MTQDAERPPLPLNAIPPVVIVLALAMAAVEILLSLGEAGLIGQGAGRTWRIQAIQDWGFAPVVWEQVVGLGNLSLDLLDRFLTYAFVHGSFTHALFAVAMTLALGKFVGDVFAWWAVLVVFFGGLIAGAVVFGLIVSGPRWLFGAYPGVYALIGAFTWLIYARLGAMGENRIKAFRMIGFLLILQLLFAALSPFLGGTSFDFAFLADLAGFVAGFALSVVVSPGGFTALRARLQNR